MWQCKGNGWIQRSQSSFPTLMIQCFYKNKKLHLNFHSKNYFHKFMLYFWILWVLFWFSPQLYHNKYIFKFCHVCFCWSARQIKVPVQKHLWHFSLFYADRITLAAFFFCGPTPSRDTERTDARVSGYRNLESLYHTKSIQTLMLYEKQRPLTYYTWMKKVR